MERTLSPLQLLLLPTLAEGPMARAELSFARDEGLGGREVELLVEAAGARLRAGLPTDAGLRVDAGCGSLRCRLAVDGLAPAVDAALPALLAESTRPAPAVALAARKASRRSWRGAWRRPSVVLAAAIQRMAEGRSAPLAERPPLRRAVLAERWASAWRSEPRLVVAGDYIADAVTSALVGRDTRLPPDAAPPLSGEPGVAASALPLLLVDWPDASRAQVALVWATTPAEATRDHALAGDFQSSLVQSLREKHTFTYDVSFEPSDTWAAASWDVRPGLAWESVAVALAALWEQGRAETPSAREAAWRRLSLGRALLADTLPGRIAASSLGPAPPRPSAAPVPPRLLGVAVVADREALSAEWTSLPGESLDRCTLLYGAGCPPGS
jgi:hypothetical protein